MDLRKIEILRAPGLNHGLAVPEVHAGHVLLVGPNASGKSTIGRVMRGTLWPEYAQAGVVADTRWSIEPDEQAASASMVFGQVQWSGTAVRVPAAAAAAWHLSVADLLRVDQKTEAPIAREIERALAGGFDLAAARAHFHPPVRPPAKLVRAIGEATEAVREARAEEADLVRREGDRATLESRRKLSEDASKELRLAEKAVEHATALRDLVLLRAELEALPKALCALRGDELDQVEGHDLALVDLDARLGETRAAKLDASRNLEQLQFPAAEPSQEVLRTHAERVRELRVLDRDLQRAGTARDAHIEKVAAAAQEIFVQVPADLRLGRAQLEQLERALEQVAEARSRAQATNQLLVDNPSAKNTLATASHEAGVHALRSWLAVSQPQPAGPRLLPRWAWPVVLLFGALIAALGWWSQLLVLQLLGSGLLGAGLALVVVALWGRATTQPAADPRSTYRGDYESGSLPAPEAWEPAAVQRRLRVLEAELDEARAARRAEEAHRRAAGQYMEARGVLQQARSALERVLDGMSLERELGDLSVLRLAQRLESLSRARAEAAAEGAKVDGFQQRRDAMLEALSAWLGTLGHDAVLDGAAAEAAVGALADRLGGLERARQELDRAERDSRDIHTRRADRVVSRTELYRQAGLEPGQQAELGKLMEALPTYTRLAQGERDLLGTIQPLTDELEGGDGWLDLDLDLDDAQRRVEQTEQLAAELADRTKAVQLLDVELANARQGHGLEQARAQLLEARACLSEAKQSAIQEAMGAELVGWVQQAMARDHQPRMLERARHWFLRFTRGAFQLDVAGDVFVARDVKLDEERRLHQLSDATRVQLLLAARLAFLEDAEGDGPKLPLFLDEALSTTDRDRFREIVRCLLELVHEGRQVFYATADRAEVDLWCAVCEQEGAEPPQVVDLAQATAGQAWEAGVPVVPLQAPGVPDPQGREPEDYLAALGVGVPGLHEPADTWHLGLLMQDDLESLSACLRAGVNSVGVWTTVRAQGGIPLPVSATVAAKTDARAEVLAATLEQARVGRGKPLPWDVVQESGAVTPAFEADMKALLLRHGEQPEVYVQEVGSLSRYRSGNKAKLHDHLIEVGVLDEREPLSTDEVCTRVLGVVARAIESEVLELGETRRLVEWIVGVVGGPSPGTGPRAVR